jgi:hypothetical protein
VAVLYFVFLLHFAIAAPTADEWAHNISIIDAATHGHLSFNLLWVQYFQSRMLFPNLLFVLVGVPTHYDPRWFVVISAICYIASFFLVLAVVRRYLGRPLQTLPTVMLALVWFSLSAVSDALWAFELSYYLVILALAVILYCLLVPERRRSLWLALAILAAVVGSYSFVQGLALWPVGLILILFTAPRTRRNAEVGIWLGAAALTVGLYFWNFQYAGTNSLCIAHCGVGYTLSHPGLTLSYWMHMVGNITPATSGGTGVVQLVLGIILTAAAAFVLIQSWRERRRKPTVALPLAIVVFALLWDMMIVSARVSLGSPEFAEYTLAQVILLVGIVIFAWVHAYEFKHELEPIVATLRQMFLGVAKPLRRGTWNFAIIAYIGLSLFLLVQVFASSQYGWDEAAAVSASRQQTGQLAVNLSEVPKDLQACYLDLIFDAGLGAPTDLASTRAFIDLAERDKLGMFGPAVVGHFRAEGPPKIPILDRVLCSRERSK